MTKQALPAMMVGLLARAALAVGGAMARDTTLDGHLAIHVRAALSAADVLELQEAMASQGDKG